MSASHAAAVALLRSYGAANIEHPGGTLLAHLERVARALRECGAQPYLVAAGLCHAAYGTDGFPQRLISLERRSELRTVIGSEAEALVYLYGSCDRGFSYPEIGSANPCRFRDRFTAQVFAPSPSRLRDFVELSFANELDLVAQNPGFAAEVGPELRRLFTRWRPLASEGAWQRFEELLLRPSEDCNP